MGIDETDDRTPRLARRRALLALGALGTGTLLYGSRAARHAAGELFSTRSAAAQSQCVLTPEQTEGPYYLDDEPFRRTISEGRPGTPLLLLLKVQNATTCTAIANAVVEIWHADASGSYSGFDGVADGTYMRGQQVTNSVGRVRFRTIYPGWYHGRTVHIHVKVHVGGNVVHTGQLFFDDAVTDVVLGAPPYAARGSRDTDNAADGIYEDGGAQSLLHLSTRTRGYQGKLTLGVQG